MQLRSKFSLVFVVLIVIFSLPQLVYALGITPSKVELEYKPGETHVITYKATNREIVDVEIKKQGEFAENIIVPSGTLKIQPTKAAEFTAEITIPKFNKPGKHTSYISVAQLPPPKEYGRPQIVALVEVASTINIFVPYPEKYLEGHLDAINVNLGETVYFTVKLTSQGVETISDVGGKVRIYDPNNKQIGEVPLTTASNIQTGDSIELYAEWSSAGYPRGMYKATAIVNYDEKTEEFDSKFRIGELYVEVLNYTKTAVQGEVNPFDIKIENQWNGEISAVYADVEVRNAENQLVDSFKTPTESLTPFEITNLRGFFNAKEAELGEHSIKIMLRYSDKTTVTTGMISVVEPKLEEEKEQVRLGFSVTVILLFGVILVIIFGVWLYVTSHKGTQQQYKNINNYSRYQRKL